MSASSEVRLLSDLHARPAAQVARAVAAFDASLSLTVGGREADARSVLSVMGLGALAGQTVGVHAEGPEASAAVAAVVALLEVAEVVTG